jgi:hypothetical protein
MRILNITSEEEEEEGIPDCFQSPPQTCFLFLSFLLKKKSKRIKQLFILLLLLRREMPNLQTFF